MKEGVGKKRRVDKSEEGMKRDWKKTKKKIKKTAKENEGRKDREKKEIKRK